MYIKGRAFRLEKNARVNYVLPIRNQPKLKKQTDDEEKYGRRYAMLNEWKTGVHN